MELDQTL